MCRRAACPHAAGKGCVVIVARWFRGPGCGGVWAPACLRSPVVHPTRRLGTGAYTMRPYGPVAHSALVRRFHPCRGGLYIRPNPVRCDRGPVVPGTWHGRAMRAPTALRALLPYFLFLPRVQGRNGQSLPLRGGGTRSVTERCAAQRAAARQRPCAHAGALRQAFGAVTPLSQPLADSGIGMLLPNLYFSQEAVLCWNSII